jgi:hypothetical protein
MDILRALFDAQIDKILIIAGIAFIFFAVGGQFGAKIISDRINPISALVAGSLFLVIGITINQASPLALVVSKNDNYFPTPTQNGKRIDWCFHRGIRCGKEKDGAADIFCQRAGFPAGVEAAAEDYGLERTFIMGGAETCPEHPGDKCSGFGFIRCKKSSSQ